MIVEIDGGAEITVDVGTYPHLTHGYAITVHKAQGVTTDRVFLFLSDRMSSREWGYVAGSRHRDEVHLYSDRSAYATMADDLSVSRPQTLALDEMPRTAGAAAGDETHRVPSPEVPVERGRAVDVGGPSTQTIRADDRDVGDAEPDAADDVDQAAPGM